MLIEFLSMIAFATAPGAFGPNGEWVPRFEQMPISSTPAVGETKSVPVGGTLFEEIAGSFVDGACVGGDADESFLGLTIVKVSKGDCLFATSYSPFVVCVGFNRQGWPTWCLADENGDGVFESGMDNNRADPRRLSEPVPYVAQKVRFPGARPPDTTTRLVYLGSDGTSLRIGRRHLVGGMPRSGDEDYTFPAQGTLPRPLTIGSVVFTLLSVDGSGVTVRREK